VQKEEIQNAFWPEPGTGGPYILGDVMRCAPECHYPNAQRYPTAGDLDIFGTVRSW